MQLSIAAILSAADLAAVREAAASAAWDDGRVTAGWSAALVKHNEQAAAEGAVANAIHLATERLLANPVFQLAARPKRIVKPMLSRHRPGASYGSHVDNAIMGGERTDLAFTLFLSDPDQYDGGALVIESAGGEEEVRLAAGDVYVYPSTTLHRVDPVIRGERLAIVGWVRSLVRDAGQREILFDLDTARRTLFDREGKSREFDLLSKSCANLLRMWCED